MDFQVGGVRPGAAQPTRRKAVEQPPTSFSNDLFSQDLENGKAQGDKGHTR